jgi:hypothetical protein
VPAQLLKEALASVLSKQFVCAGTWHVPNMLVMTTSQYSFVLELK